MSTRLLVAFMVLIVLPTMVTEELYHRRLRKRRTVGFSALRYRRHLAKAADRAISAARTAVPPGGLALVTVQDVQWRAYRDFGLWPIPRCHAADVLRERLNRHCAWLDIVSDLDIDEPLQ